MVLEVSARGAWLDIDCEVVIVIKIPGNFVMESCFSWSVHNIKDMLADFRLVSNRS